MGDLWSDAGLVPLDVVMVTRADGRGAGEAIVVLTNVMEMQMALSRDKQHMGRRCAPVASLCSGGSLPLRLMLFSVCACVWLWAWVSALFIWVCFVVFPVKAVVVVGCCPRLQIKTARVLARSLFLPRTAVVGCSFLAVPPFLSNRAAAIACMRRF